MKTSIKMIVGAALATMASSIAAAEVSAAAISVYKTPWCGCCHTWAESVEKAGYEVKSTDMEDLAPVRKMAGVPADMEGCHVAAVDGYFLEGHVPLEAIAKLLAEKPDIAGIAVPGMPDGSLGMGDDPKAVYDVYAISRDSAKAPTLFYRAGG